MNAAHTLTLWTGEAPRARGDAPHDSPRLAVYPAVTRQPRNAGILVLPGGGYQNLAAHEGEGYAAWLTSLGLTAVVLSYRLASNGYHYPTILLDALRAMQLMREHAKEWGFDPATVGIIGSSAGGHLASMVMTQRDPMPEFDEFGITSPVVPPAYGILCYPVISLAEEYAHGGSRDALAGDALSDELAEALSAERRVTADTPPCFLWHGAHDAAVPVRNSLAFADALAARGVTLELHVYADAPHGIGLANGHAWTHACAAWLETRLPVTT